MKKFTFLTILTLLISLVFIQISFASYPEKAITVIVPFGAGGGTDLNARVIERHAKKYLGVPVAVVNKPGGGGEIGFTTIANSTPDGYTIGYTNIPNVVQPPILRDANYSIDDFAPIIAQVIEPKIIAVPTNSDFQSWEELVRFAKENPFSLTIANNGVGSHGEYVIENATLLAGIYEEVLHVPYDGAGPMRAAVLGGHADALPLGISEYLNEEESFRPLIVFTKERREEIPEVPTSFELGIEQEISAVRCLVAPAGTQRDIIDFLHNAFKSMWEDPAYKEDMKKTGAIGYYLTPEQIKEMYKVEEENFKKYIEMTNQN